MVTGLRIRESLEFVKSRISPYRFEHSIRVARTAVRLSRHYGLDPGKAWLAGIFHDIAREIPGAKLIEMSEHMGIHSGSDEIEQPILLHGRVGAGILNRRFPETEPEIIKAVENHIRGGNGLGSLEMIIYIADFIEPGRKFFRSDFNDWGKYPRVEDLYHWVETTSGLYYKKRTRGDIV